MQEMQILGEEKHPKSSQNHLELWDFSNLAREMNKLWKTSAMMIKWKYKWIITTKLAQIYKIDGDSPYDFTKNLQNEI